MDDDVQVAERTRINKEVVNGYSGLNVDSLVVYMILAAGMDFPVAKSRRV